MEPLLKGENVSHTLHFPLFWPKWDLLFSRCCVERASMAHEWREFLQEKAGGVKNAARMYTSSRKRSDGRGGFSIFWKQSRFLFSRSVHDDGKVRCIFLTDAHRLCPQSSCCVFMRVDSVAGCVRSVSLSTNADGESHTLKKDAVMSTN